MQHKTYRELLADYTIMLKASSDTPYLDASCIMTHLLDCEHSIIYTDPERIVTQEEKLRLDKAFAARIQGKPVAYITGLKSFWKFELLVNESCFIPRSDTECLIEKILDMTEFNSCLMALDLGTGSGAIAISLAQARPNWQITASDINNEALSLAYKNASRYQLTNINFLYSNWFDNIDGNFDIIVSNPPYIAYDEEIALEVTFEPASALFAANSGLFDLEIIIRGAVKYQGCLLVLEHSPQQRVAVFNYLTRHGYCKIDHIKDLSGAIRGTIAYAPLKNM